MAKIKPQKCGLKLSGVPIVLFSPAFAELTGSLNAGIMLGVAVYWQSMNPEDGWWFQTQVKWSAETWLERKQQSAARKRLRQFPFWSEKRKGIPAKLYYKVNLRMLAEMLGCSLVERSSKPTATPKQNPYSEFYKTDEWKVFRQKIIDRDGGQCVDCGSCSETLQAHHLYYITKRKPWEYQESALLTLCRKCHASRHANPTVIEEWEKQVGGIQ